VATLGTLESVNPQGLREDIKAAELVAAKARRERQASDVLELFRLLDRIEAGMAELGELGVDLRAEESRIDTIHSQLLENAQRTVRLLGPVGALERLRALEGLSAPEGQANLAETRWWWYLDQHVAASARQRARRTLWTAGVVLVVLAILSTVYMIFLRPDEATRLRFGYVSQAEGQIEQGEYEAALAFYQQAHEVAPDDPEIVLMIGMMSEVLGRTEDATAYYARAEDLYGNRVAFLAAKSQQYNMTRQYEKAEKTALEAIEADDQSAWSYCNLGSAYEGQGRIPEAIVALQACADLAREQEQNELYVIATSRLAMLMQMPIGIGETTPKQEQGAE
jgi:tetratricopeptide (TPR) repeat protein